MGIKIIKKVMNTVFPGPADEEELMEEEMDREQDKDLDKAEELRREDVNRNRQTSSGLFRDKRGESSRDSKTLRMALNDKRVGAVIFRPTSFDDSPHIADRLRNNQMVILNFEETDNLLAKRMTDFISGTIYALDGSMKKIGNKILLCAPKNFDIDAEKNIYDSKGEQPWKD